MGSKRKRTRQRGDDAREFERNELDIAARDAEQHLDVELGVGAAADAGAAPSGSAGLVDVDRAAIRAEAEAIAATAPADPGAPPASSPAPGLDEPAGIPGDPSSTASEIKVPIRLLCKNTARAFAPNWEISDKESDDVADALALTLAYWMPPGAVDPKYMVVFTLATSIYGVAATRREPDGSFKPLRARPSSTSPPAPAGTPPARPPLSLV
jgi:hypothetical protein